MKSRLAALPLAVFLAGSCIVFIRQTDPMRLQRDFHLPVHGKKSSRNPGRDRKPSIYFVFGNVTVKTGRFRATFDFIVEPVRFEINKSVACMAVFTLQMARNPHLPEMLFYQNVNDGFDIAAIQIPLTGLAPVFFSRRANSRESFPPMDNVLSI